MNRLSVLVGTAVSLAAHLYLGWMFSVLGPIVAGVLSPSRPGLAGMSAQVLAWGGLVGWNMAVAPQESLNMMETLGGLLGGMPAFVTPLLTMLIAALLGLTAGWLGGASRKKDRST